MICPRYKVQNQSSETASTSVMTDSDSDAFLVASADGKSNWTLDLGSAYYLYRDRDMFSTFATCEGFIRMSNNTANRVVGKGTF